jgi:uncharacterized protein with FMN-binding domain
LRRTIRALVGFVLATTVLIGLKSAPTAARLGWSAEEPLTADPSLSGDAANPTAGPGGPSGSAGPAGSASAGPPSLSPSAPGSGSTAPTSAPPPAPAPAKRTILGPAVATSWKGSNYGTTQVQIVVTGTHIDDIVAVKQSNRPGSSASTLRAQALAAQSANVGNVSGATASSNAYKQSLQGAINGI